MGWMPHFDQTKYIRIWPLTPTLPLPYNVHSTNVHSAQLFIKCFTIVYITSFLEGKINTFPVLYVRKMQFTGGNGFAYNYIPRK